MVFGMPDGHMLLREFGRVTEETPVVTTVHPSQILEQIPTEDHQGIGKLEGGVTYNDLGGHGLRKTAVWIVVGFRLEVAVKDHHAPTGHVQMQLQKFPGKGP